MSTLIDERVELARRGQNPMVIARLASGWAVLGDYQFFKGYSLLLSDPVVPSLNDLSLAERSRFLLDMTALGDALLAVTDAVRINYEILGNTDPALHAHVFPRYASEEPHVLREPIWNYRRDQRMTVPFSLTDHGPLMNQFRAHLEAAGVVVSG
jgi:diadenosine tetraphosphate (Ap4A) HIT family hydrolase